MIVTVCLGKGKDINTQFTHVAILHGSDVWSEAAVGWRQGGFHARLQLIETHRKVSEVVHLGREEKGQEQLSVCACVEVWFTNTGSFIKSASSLTKISIMFRKSPDNSSLSPVSLCAQLQVCNRRVYEKHLIQGLMSTKPFLGDTEQTESLCRQH